MFYDNWADGLEQRPTLEVGCGLNSLVDFRPSAYLISRFGAPSTESPCILPSMSIEPEYIHHSLNIHPAEKAVADEVSAEAGIDIEFKAPLWSDTESPAEDMVRVYCKTQSDAARFERAFERRRWEDSKNPPGE